MKISILGLGYVGTVTAACLAREGHDVIGIDSNQAKVELIDEGNAPIIEKDVGEIIAAATKAGRLRATKNTTQTINETEISLICVGTPSQANGSLDLGHLRRVCEQIGTALKTKRAFHIVVTRSTTLPGSIRKVVIPTLEEYSSKKAGVDFSVCNNPEFLREGTAVHDFYNPPKTIIGETDARGGDRLAMLYEKIEAPMFRTDIETAEMVKYIDNAWHALKVGFANEIGNICKELSIDGHQAMNIFCQDTKLNLSPYYLKPGFAFGGSCLPKDLRALTYKARSLDLDLPILNSILPSNERQVERGLKIIIGKGNKKIGFLGFSFKAGTDDLRESPIVELVERLLGKGYDIRLYDRNVNLARLVGANRDYILNRIPHIAKLMVDSLEDILTHADTLVIGNADREFGTIPERVRADQSVVDLVRIGDGYTNRSNYDGICW